MEPKIVVLIPLREYCDHVRRYAAGEITRFFGPPMSEYDKSCFKDEPEDILEYAQSVHQFLSMYGAGGFRMSDPEDPLYGNRLFRYSENVPSSRMMMYIPFIFGEDRGNGRDIEVCGSISFMHSIPYMTKSLLKFFDDSENFNFSSEDIDICIQYMNITMDSDDAE